LRFFCIAVVTGVIVWGVQEYMYFQGRAYIEERLDALSALQDKQLSAFLEMNRLLTTLGTTLLGATGFLLNTRRRGAEPHMWLGLASALCIGLSIYFGYEAYEDILWMLEGRFFDLSNPEIHWTHAAEFYTFLLGAIFFCAFVTHRFTAVRPSESP
jgi:hypothetical protein